MPRVTPVLTFPNKSRIVFPAENEKDLFHKNEDFLDPDLIINWPEEVAKHLQDAYEEINRLKIKCGEKVEEFNDHMDQENYEDEEDYSEDDYDDEENPF